MRYSNLLVWIALTVLSPSLHAQEYPYVIKVFNYLDVDLDARTAGLSGLSVVASPVYPEAGTSRNPALLCGDQRFFTVSGNSSSLLWMKGISNWGEGLSGTFAFNKTNTVSASISYYDRGKIWFTDESGTEEYLMKSFDLYAKLSYAHSFGKGISVGGAIKYCHSDNSLQPHYSGPTAQDIGGVSVDLGFSYRKTWHPAKKFELGLNTGVSLINLGPRLNWDMGNITIKTFQPASLLAGILLTPAFDLSPKWKLSVDAAYQADKELIPSFPEYSVDAEGGYTIIKGRDPDVSALVGIFQSFYDSPDGFKGEIDEIGHRTALEVRVSKSNLLYFATRYSHRWQPLTPGYYSVGMGGLSVGVHGFYFDFYRVLDTPGAARLEGWHKNLGFSFGFRGNLSGKMFTF